MISYTLYYEVYVEELYLYSYLFPIMALGMFAGSLARLHADLEETGFARICGLLPLQSP